MELLTVHQITKNKLSTVKKAQQHMSIYFVLADDGAMLVL